MTQALDDPRLVRRLLRACRRAGSRLRRSPRPRGENSPIVMLLLRLLFLVGLTFTAGTLARGIPLASQVVPLSAMAMAWLGTFAWRNQLGTTPDLGVLAQLPVARTQVFDRQSAGVWKVAVWSGIEAIAFWCVAWPADHKPWPLLPLIGAASGVATLAAVMLSMLWLPNRVGGFALLAIVGLAAGMIFSKGDLLAWPGIPQALESVRLATPWGWITILAAKAPREPSLAASGLAAVIGLSAVAAILARRRLCADWCWDPAWREVAGSRTHALFAELIPDEQSPCETTSEVPCAVSVGPGALDAWREARQAPLDPPLLALGWVGRRVRSRFDRRDLLMVGLLRPHGPSDATWAWAMLLTGSCATVALLGLSPGWAMVALGLALLYRGKRVAAAFAMAVAGSAGIFRDQAIVILIFQVLVGLAIATPYLGGSWGGLPQTTSPLADLPRRWASLHRSMMLLLGWRLVAAIPVTGLAALALGHGVHPFAGIFAVLAWVACALAMPWITAMRLTSTTPAGLDIDYGWSWHTAVLVGLLLLHGVAIVVIGAGTYTLVCGRWAGALEVGAGLVAGLAISVALVRLLGHLYRYRVDLIARLSG